MGKMSKGMVRWQLLSIPTYVVLSGRYFKVSRAFPNLIFVKLGSEEGERSLKKENASFEEQKS